jgi:hypothetical protein
MLIPAIGITLTYLGYPRSYQKIWKLLLVFFCVVMILSFSRAGYLLTGALFLTFLAKTSFGKNIRYLMIVVLMTVIGIRLFGLLLSAAKIPLFNSWLLPYLYKPFTNEQRLDYLLQSLRGVASRPLFGWGLGSFYTISTQYASSPGFASSVPFNYYLEVLAETGFVGEILFICLVGFLIRQVYLAAKNNHRFYGWYVCVIGICISALLDVTFSHISLLLYFFMISATFIGQSGHLKKPFRLTSIMVCIIVFAVWLLAFLLGFNDVLFDIGRKNDNYGLMQVSIRIFPFRPEQYDYLSIRYFYKSDYSKSAELNSSARRLEPNNWIYNFHGYQIYSRLMKPLEKSYFLSRVKALNPADYKEYIDNWDYNESLKKN